MSRRPVPPPVGRVDRARSRMAPGGRMWSESPLRYPRKRTAWSGVPQPPAVPDQIYWSLWTEEATYGNGSIYPLPPASTTVGLTTTDLGTITGLPCIVLVKADTWKDFTFTGWNKRFEYVSGDHTAAVFTLDEYAGESLSGSCVPTRTPGLSGADFRINAQLIVADVAGAWTPNLGTPDANNMILTEPVAEQRFQWVASAVRYDRTWSPSLPTTMGRAGNLWSAAYINGAQASPGGSGGSWEDSGLSTAAMGTGTYVPSSGASNIPVNVTFA